MEVQVLYRLASISTAIGDNAVTSAQRFACGDLGDNLKDLGDVYAVFGVDFISRCDVNLGHYKNMYGCLGIDIAESINVFILINLRGRDVTLDDLTKKAIHCSFLVDPPNVTEENQTDKVYKPHKGDTNEDEYDCENNANHILLLKAAAETVYHPNDSDCRNAKDELDDLRKIVKCLDDGIHFNTSFIF